MSFLDTLRKGFGYVLLSMGVSRPEAKPKPRPSAGPESKAEPNAGTGPTPSSGR